MGLISRWREYTHTSKLFVWFLFLHSGEMTQKCWSPIAEVTHSSGSWQQDHRVVRGLLTKVKLIEYYVDIKSIFSEQGFEQFLSTVKSGIRL